MKERESWEMCVGGQQLLQSSFIMQCLVGYVRLPCVVRLTSESRALHARLHTDGWYLSFSLLLSDWHISLWYILGNLFLHKLLLMVFLFWKWFWIALIKAFKYCTKWLDKPSSPNCVDIFPLQTGSWAGHFRDLIEISEYWAAYTVQYCLMFLQPSIFRAAQCGETMKNNYEK